MDEMPLGDQTQGWWARYADWLAACEWTRRQIEAMARDLGMQEVEPGVWRL